MKLYYKRSLPFVETKKDNTEYWNFLERLRKEGKCVGSRWEMDYLVNTYEFEGKLYDNWYDAEYGIESLIEEVIK